MADVNINKFRASVVRDGSKPASPGFIVSEGQDPVNPPGTNNYVPYSGATANVELGEYGVEAGFITLDTTPTNTPTDQGTIFWDADDETVDIVLNGYTMKIGEDLFYPVKNQTGSTIAKGVAVRFNGTVGASGRLLIAPFIADGSVPSSRFMGVTAEEILNGEDGKVLYFGRVRGINTNAFNEGDILYASTTVAGGYQTAIPVAPNNIVQVAAVVTKSATVGTIFVRPTLGSNINKDEGVKIVSVADKNLLQYQSGTSLWENKSLAQVLGGTSAQFVKGDGSLDSTSYGTGTVTSVGLSSATSGVTIGSTPVTTSGTITLAIATASGSQNGLLSSTDWTTFNGKQNALTNPVTGTGTTNYLPKFTGSTTIGNSNLINDANGNLGFGVTPSAWSTSNDVKAFQLGGDLVIWRYGTAPGSIYFGSNYYWSGTNRIYLNSGFASEYVQTESKHIWNIAPSGTAGNAISFTQAMTLFSTGNLLVGSPSPISDNGARLQVSGGVKMTGNLEIDGTFSSPSGADKFIGVYGGQDCSLILQDANQLWELYVNDDFYINRGSTNVLTALRSNGNVGIGTASPSSRLHVKGSGTDGLILERSAAGQNVFIKFQNENSIDVWQQLVTGTAQDFSITRLGGTGNIQLGSSGGNVLIGTTTDNGVGKLQVNGNITVAGTVRFSASGADANRWSVYWNGGTGDLIVVNNISDIRAKKDFDYDIKGLETITKLKPLKFTWKDGTSHSTSVSGRLRQYGFIAQETMQADDFLAWHNESHDTWGIEQYESFAAVMVKAIQELKQEIDTLKN